MGALTHTLALLCTLCWTAGSVREFPTTGSQPGQRVTFMCSNFSTFPSHITWFRLAGAKVSRISVMFRSDAAVTAFAGFRDGKFTMFSNNSHIFLSISPVISSDSGLYFCGCLKNEDLVIVSGTYLNVEEVPTPYESLVLGGVIILLTLVIVCLFAYIRTSHTAQEREENPQPARNQDSDAMNYAAMRFQPRAPRGTRPAANSESAAHVVYATTR